MSRVDDLMNRYSKIQPNKNLVQTETYSNTINRSSNNFDRYNVAPQNLSVGNYTNHGAHGRFGTTELIERSNNFPATNDSRSNRLGTQDLLTGSSNLNYNAGQKYTDFDPAFKKTDSLHFENTTKSPVDGMVQVVAMGAEMERLNQKIKAHQNQPILQAPSNYNQEELQKENVHLKNKFSSQEHNFNNLEEENYKLKDREKQLKDRLSELNEENKRLMAMQVQKGKGGAWCC